MEEQIDRMVARLEAEEAKAKDERSDASPQARLPDGAAAQIRAALEDGREQLPWWAGLLYAAVIAAGFACVLAYAFMSEPWSHRPSHRLQWAEKAAKGELHGEL